TMLKRAGSMVMAISSLDEQVGRRVHFSRPAGRDEGRVRGILDYRRAGGPKTGRKRLEIVEATVDPRTIGEHRRLVFRYLFPRLRPRRRWLVKLLHERFEPEVDQLDVLAGEGEPVSSAMNLVEGVRDAHATSFQARKQKIELERLSHVPDVTRFNEL